MLTFIGGAARTGKGILVRRLLAERHLPFLSLDVLKMGVTRGLPECALDPDAGAMRVAERLWPLVREMSKNLLMERLDYAFEGEILPGHVAALRQVYPTQITACFLGYCTIDPAQKLAEIRAHAGHANDWPQEYTDEDLLAVIRREIAFSQYLQAECARLDFPYYDVSEQFIPTLDAVTAYLSVRLLNG